MTEKLLEVREISKFYGKVPAFEALSLSVEKGEIFGLLGLNGAGKTTLFKSILNLVKISSGEILFLGKPLASDFIHEKVGYLPELFVPPGELTGREFLSLLGFSISVPSERVRGLLEKTGLDPSKRIGDYSRGMIQRLGLAVALLKDPEFVMLDEPTLGLDPIAQQQMLEWLRELHGQGKTILFSSHNLFHMEKLCHRVAIMHRGGIRFAGPVAEFLGKHSTTSLEDGFLKEVDHHA